MREVTMGEQGSLFGMPPPEPKKTPRELGHDAAKAAADKAEREKAGWIEAACVAYATFAQKVYPAKFITKEAREYAEKVHKVPPPTEPRSWGHIPKKLQARGVIEPVGSANPPHVHGGEVTEWRWIPQ